MAVEQPDLRGARSPSPPPKQSFDCPGGRGKQQVTTGRCAACQYERENPMPEPSSVAPVQPPAPRRKQRKGLFDGPFGAPR